MLIGFAVENFRSISEGQSLSMSAGRYSEFEAENTVVTRVPAFERLVRTAAIYGANAAGKTNLLRALQFVQQLVVGSAAAQPSTPIPVTPFKFSRQWRDAPSWFDVGFIQNGRRYQYYFKLTSERILEERLSEFVTSRGRTLFERTYVPESKTYNWKFGEFLKGERSVWRDATRQNALFLSTSIQLNNQQLLPVFEWFQKRLVVIVGLSSLNVGLTLKLLETQNGYEKLLPFLREADLGITGVQVNREIVPGTGGVVLNAHFIEPASVGSSPSAVKITFSHSADDSENGKLDLGEESSGTQILFRSAGAWLNVFDNGEVILIDEIDTSMHPLITEFLIRKFHSPRSNPKDAQLIFSTHDTALLSADLLRRDQIWFIEKQNDGSSKLFPLTEFKTRSGEPREKYYLKGRYGALPFLDSA